MQKQKAKIIDQYHEINIAAIRTATYECGQQKQAMNQEERLPDNYYAIGDNFDITVSPTYMTATNQRKSYHWFMALGIKKRVSDATLSDDKPLCNIADMSCTSWIPSDNELKVMTSNFSHHVTKVMMRFKFLNRIDITVPDNITHRHMDETSRKSDFCIVDLIDASENKSEGMIRIMKELHELFVSQSNKQVLQRTEFAGDVLTNERAFASQCAMDNGDGSFDSLGGFNYRPGGLHLIMNLCVVTGT